MGKGKLSNGVQLIVNSCVEMDKRIVDGKQQCKYAFNFSVTLPPPNGLNYAEPLLGINWNADFRTEEEPVGTTRKSLFVSYQSIIPSIFMPSPENITYPLSYPTGWVDEVKEGAVTFMGTNIDPETGKKVRAKSSTTPVPPIDIEK